MHYNGAFLKTLVGIVAVSAMLVGSNCFAGKAVGDVPYDSLGKAADKRLIKVSDYKGKLVIITFWATWCGPCMKELPVLGGIQKTVGADKLQVIAMNYRESRKMFRKVSKALSDHDMIIGYDPKGRFAEKYGVGGIPHMVIVGGDGLIKAIHVGYGEGALPGLVAEINQEIKNNQQRAMAE